MERKMINVDVEVADKIKQLYPGRSWTSILSILLEDKDSDVITREELNALKEKFDKVIRSLIEKNDLTI